ncbi:MAG TPA: hypothetical protein VKR52_05795 [Terracidiphilus sp.]|nr:hypothetical protein [Terracidiphilus sp.]
MLIAMINGGKMNGDRQILKTDSITLWIRFFGWFGTGVFLGWSMRSSTHLANSGAIKFAIIMLASIVIVSQIGIALSPLFLSKNKRITKTFDR